MEKAPGSYFPRNVASDVAMQQQHLGQVPYLRHSRRGRGLKDLTCHLQQLYYLPLPSNMIIHMDCCKRGIQSLAWMHLRQRIYFTSFTQEVLSLSPIIIYIDAFADEISYLDISSPTGLSRHSLLHKRRQSCRRENFQ